MRKHARSLLTRITDLTDRVLSRITVAAFNAVDALKRCLAAIWEAHQQHMADQPGYAPQLAVLVGIVMSLLRLPTWLSRIVASFLDLYLGTSVRRSTYPRVAWGSMSSYEEPEW